MLHYGHLAWDSYERMLAFSQANQVRWNRGISVLQERRDAAETNGNWYEAAQVQGIERYRLIRAWDMVELGCGEQSTHETKAKETQSFTP